MRFLPPDVRPTYRCHWVYSVLSGCSTGILTNAPTIGIKVLRAADWHLALATGLTGIGLLMSLILGVWMARRPKMPFVLVPGFISSAICLGMVGAPEPLRFLFLLGLCNLFEIITRPAITAVIRANYPVDSRGLVTGTLRQWSSGMFLVTALATAAVLDSVSTWSVIQMVITVAAALQTGSFVAFALIRVRPDSAVVAQGTQPDWWTTLPVATSIVSRDSRFLRYLLGCFVFGVGGLSYEPIVRAYFSTELHLNYLQCVVLVDVLPSVCSVLTLERMGAWLDRTNPLFAWAVIRVAWGLDAILLALAPGWPIGAMAVAAAARVSRGCVMNGSWLLWWQLGTNYFATRRELTSVYMGCLLTITGVQRMCGPQLGALMVGRISRRGVLLIGGLTVLFSAFLAWRQAEAEKVHEHYPTFTDKEHAE